MNLVSHNWATHAEQFQPAATTAAPRAELLTLGDLATPSPEEPLSTAELGFIMKAIQGLVGEFSQVELGGVAERPETENVAICHSHFT